MTNKGTETELDGRNLKQITFNAGMICNINDIQEKKLVWSWHVEENGDVYMHVSPPPKIEYIKVTDDMPYARVFSEKFSLEIYSEKDASGLVRIANQLKVPGIPKNKAITTTDIDATDDSAAGFHPPIEGNV